LFGPREAQIIRERSLKTRQQREYLVINKKKVDSQNERERDKGKQEG
jgi:hypothetical protein